MLSRDYNRKIEVWFKSTTPDGFGGRLPVDILVKNIWAKITSYEGSKFIAGNKFVQFGIQDFKNPVMFSIRGVKNGIAFTENHFIRYQGKDFFIKSVDNRGYEGMEINLLCDES